MTDLVTVMDSSADLFGLAWAEFDPDRERRYVLGRRWADGRSAAVFVMLNPSTADARADDPTIRRCIGFAKREHCGSLVVVNLFTLRSPNPKMLYRHPDPVGVGADDILLRHCCLKDRVVIAAWGSHGGLLDRGTSVRTLLARHGVQVHCFGLTALGQPRHPLYLPAHTPLISLDEAATHG